MKNQNNQLGSIAVQCRASIGHSDVVGKKPKKGNDNLDLLSAMHGG